MARIHEHTVNIAAPLMLVSAIPLAMQGDAEADELRLSVVNGKEPADMTGYTVGGYLERADGIRVMLKGNVTADVVEVKLQEACYRVPGAYKAFVRLTKTTGEKMTLFLFAGRIESEGDGEIVDEEDTIPSVEELIAMIEEIDRAIEEANEARDDANAAATGATAAAEAAKKAAGDAQTAIKAANDAADKANEAADSADEAAAGASAWAKATMEANSLPEGSAPTISVEKAENGGNVIRVGIPAGKTGETGETGATPQITFEVETGAAGSKVQVEQSGTAEEPHIKLTIPRGDTGAVEGVDYYEGDPEALGTANPGTANGLARGDHVHPMPKAEDVGAQPAGDYALRSEVPAAYTLPTATADTLGGVKSSEAVTVGADGTMTVNRLNGKDADKYMLKTDTAADSDKLGGVGASEYTKKSDLLEKKIYIFLGDSYDQYGGWVAKTATALGLSEEQIVNLATPSSNIASGGWQGFLTTWCNDNADKLGKVSHVICGGGINDSSAEWTDVLDEKIGSLCVYAKNMLPNARIMFAYFGYALTTSSILGDRNYYNRNVAQAIWSKCGKYGAEYLSGCESILHNADYLDDDGLHPNEQGGDAISAYLSSAIKTGACNVCYPIRNVSMSALEGTISGYIQEHLFNNTYVLQMQEFGLTGASQLLIGNGMQGNVANAVGVKYASNIYVFETPITFIKADNSLITLNCKVMFVNKYLQIEAVEHVASAFYATGFKPINFSLTMNSVVC